jgi:transposase
MDHKRYPSDLTDAAWAIVAPCVPVPKRTGRPASIVRRELLNAMVYVTKTGCGWEWRPHDVPKWKPVYQYFRLWRITRVWAAIHAALRARVRQARGRDEQPSATISDSQSVTTTRVGGPERGYDGGKKGTGGNVISALTRMGSWCPFRATQRISLTVTAHHACLRALRSRFHALQRDGRRAATTDGSAPGQRRTCRGMGRSARSGGPAGAASGSCPVKNHLPSRAACMWDLSSAALIAKVSRRTSA